MSAGLLPQLKGCIQAYLDEHPQVGIMGLARRSRVSHMSIRRILSEDLKTVPAPNTVLNLVSAISKEADFTRLIEKHSGPVGEFLRGAFPHYKDLKAPHAYRPDLEASLSDRETFLIFLLCSTRAGTSLQEISRLFGALGEEKARELVDQGIIEQGPDGALKGAERNYYLSTETARRFAGSLLSFIKPALMPEGANVFYSIVESVNESGMKEIVRIQSEAVRKLRAVLNSEEYKGDLPVFTLNASDTMSLPSRAPAPQETA